MTWIVHAIAAAGLVSSLLSINWGLFRQSPLLQHLALGGIAVLSFIWSLSAKLEFGLSIHFLGITALTLMLGLRHTLVAGALLVLLNQFVSQYSMDMISAVYISHVMVPATVTYIVYAYIYHHLPRHPFVYLFVNAFIAGALAIGATHLVHAFWAWSTGYLSWDNIWQNYLLITPLVMFPEALLNGMAVTLMVVYKPDWLKTFSDSVYLDDN